MSYFSGTSSISLHLSRKRIDMEEILHKFINEGKREHEEMRAFINDFKTTNEILLKERDDSLIELRFEVQKLLRIIESPPTSNCKIKGVTTRGGKTTTHEVQKDDTNMNGEEPPKEAHDKLRKTQESIRHIDPVNTLYSEKKPELEKISKEEKSSLLQVLKKLKKAEDLATCHFSRFENPHMEVLTEREIADKLFDDHLMVLKSKFKDDEPCANITAKKVYESGFYWPIIFKDANEYAKSLMLGIDFMGTNFPKS
ncbi:hypothetical protein Tco_0393168 [Tanacetum coccineum]